LLIAETSSQGLRLIGQNPALPAILPSVVQPSTDQEAGTEFTCTPHIHPGVSSEVLQGVQFPGSTPALGRLHASPLAMLYEQWSQEPADSFDGPSHQAASLQQAMPPTNMGDDTVIGPHEIPNMEDAHVGVPSTGEFSNTFCHSITQRHMLAALKCHSAHRLHRASWMPYYHCYCYRHTRHDVCWRIAAILLS